MFEIQFQLNYWKNQFFDWEKFESEVSVTLNYFQSINDEYSANLLWGYREIAQCHRFYLKAFYSLCKREYYDAWCLFEMIEISISSIKRNCTYDINKFGIGFLEDSVYKFQNIYPYGIFQSAEFIIKKSVCSICGEIFRISKKPCHIVGMVYNGKLCIEIIKGAELAGVALVHNPVQKACVPFIENEEIPGLQDHYDYSWVERTVQILEGPYDDKWNITKIIYFTQHPDKIEKETLCPCNSLKEYQQCCMNKKGIERTHTHIDFKVQEWVLDFFTHHIPLKKYSSKSPFGDGVHVE